MRTGLICGSEGGRRDRLGGGGVCDMERFNWRRGGIEVQGRRTPVFWFECTRDTPLPCGRETGKPVG